MQKRLAGWWSTYCLLFCSLCWYLWTFWYCGLSPGVVSITKSPHSQLMMQHPGTGPKTDSKWHCEESARLTCLYATLPLTGRITISTSSFLNHGPTNPGMPNNAWEAPSDFRSGGEDQPAKTSAVAFHQSYQDSGRRGWQIFWRYQTFVKLLVVFWSTLTLNIAEFWAQKSLCKPTFVSCCIFGFFLYGRGAGWRG